MISDHRYCVYIKFMKIHPSLSLLAHMLHHMHNKTKPAVQWQVHCFILQTLDLFLEQKPGSQQGRQPYHFLQKPYFAKFTYSLSFYLKGKESETEILHPLIPYPMPGQSQSQELHRVSHSVAEAHDLLAPRVYMDRGLGSNPDACARTAAQLLHQAQASGACWAEYDLRLRRE